MAARPPLLAFLIVMGSVLFGCPYESDRPLSQPDRAVIDPSLPGTWVPEKPLDAPGFVEILSFNEHELLILVREKESLDLYRAFTTAIGGKKFLNVREIGSAAGEAAPWNFVNYSVERDRLIYRIVEDTVAERENLSPGGFVALIRKDPANPELYDEECGGVLLRADNQKE